MAFFLFYCASIRYLLLVGVILRLFLIVPGLLPNAVRSLGAVGHCRHREKGSGGYNSDDWLLQMHLCPFGSLGSLLWLGEARLVG